MTKRWDDWGPDWSLRTATIPNDPPRGALDAVLIADAAWRKLTRPQQELLLSTAAGAPVAARADVRTRLTKRGLIDECGVTGAGWCVIHWRAR